MASSLANPITNQVRGFYQACCQKIDPNHGRPRRAAPTVRSTGFNSIKDRSVYVRGLLCVLAWTFYDLPKHFIASNWPTDLRNTDCSPHPHSQRMLALVLARRARL